MGEHISETLEPVNPKSAAMFNIMLDDKKAIHEHLQKGGELEDILYEIQLQHAAISDYLKKGGKLEDYKRNDLSF